MARLYWIEVAQKMNAVALLLFCGEYFRFSRRKINAEGTVALIFSTLSHCLSERQAKVNSRALIHRKGSGVF